MKLLTLMLTLLCYPAFCCNGTPRDSCEPITIIFEEYQPVDELAKLIEQGNETNFILSTIPSKPLADIVIPVEELTLLPWPWEPQGEENP